MLDSGQCVLCTAVKKVGVTSICKSAETDSAAAVILSASGVSQLLYFVFTARNVYELSKQKQIYNRS